MKLFHRHLEEQNMSYAQHLKHALRHAAKLFLCSSVLVIHAVFPFVFESYTSSRVELK